MPVAEKKLCLNWRTSLEIAGKMERPLDVSSEVGK
jgi:hypothetical protein